MGDPKKARRRYQRPSHPWQGERIKREDEYVRKYGLKNKKEFWKAESKLREQRAQARSHIPRLLRDDPQAEREAEHLLNKLNNLGLLQDDAGLDDVLALDVDSLLSRRLQTVAYMKGLAATPNQARQFIVHGHIAIGDRRVTVPGRLVTRKEEQAVDYAPTSPMTNPAHPLRQEVPGGPDPQVSAEDAEEIAAEVEETLEEETEDAEPDAEEAEEATEDESEADDESPDEETTDEETTDDAAEEPSEADAEEAEEATEAADEETKEGDEA